jgi:uncharacterized protein (TIGR02270 family)
MSGDAVLEQIVSQHAMEAAVWWLRRSQLVQEPHIGLVELASLDARLLAHLDGLREAQPAALAICEHQARLGFADDVFPLAVLSIESGDFPQWNALVERTAETDLHDAALASAMVWAQDDSVRSVIGRWLAEDNPRRRRLALSAAAERGEATQAAVRSALESDCAKLQALAARLVGELGFGSLTDSLNEWVSSPNLNVADSAAWSLLLFEPSERAIEQLTDCVRQQRALAFEAAGLFARVLPRAECQPFIVSLADDEATWRLAATMMGRSGDVSWVNRLLADMQIASRARLAGEAVSLLLGISLELPPWRGEPVGTVDTGPSEDPGDARVALDPDEHRPWPNRDLLLRWWSERASSFEPDQLYLLGQPIEGDWLGEVLARGRQPARRIAALELMRLGLTSSVFSTTTRSDWQAARLAARNARGNP